MYNPDTDLLFPPRLLPDIRDLRGDTWSELVNTVERQEPTASTRVAFELLMVRICGCATCQADSFRAMQGCTLCSTQTVKRYRGSDDDLLRQFSEAKVEVEAYLGKGT